MSRLLRSAPWVVGLLVVVAAGAARPQGNIDAGKSPAQLFSETCSGCHKSAQQLKRSASASFLRQHYMTGAQEASAMASYLAGVTSDPRSAEQRKEHLKALEEKAKARQERALERVKAQQQAREQAKAQQAARGHRELGKAVAPPAAVAEAPQEPTQHADVPAVPKLAPFEE